jgi:3-oxoadipate enol-lactonase
MDRTFVFINSLGTDFRIWDSVAASLSSLGNILRFDNRGHGLSDVVPGTSSVHDMATDAHELINRLSSGKIIVVGLSVGGMMAQVLANIIPERIEKLVLCDTRHRIGNADIWNERINTVTGHGLEKIADGVMDRWFSESFRKKFPAEVQGYRNMLVRTPVPGYVATCEAIRDGDLTAEATSIRVPTICIVGAEDKSTPVEEVRSLSALIPGSAFEVIEDAGHIPCVDNPKALVKLIKDFVS